MTCSISYDVFFRKDTSLGTLYLIGHGIGNEAETSPYALEILKKIPVLACEDTRKIKKLFSDFQIPHSRMSRKFISYFEDNEKIRMAQIMEILKSGSDVGVMVSRGMPLISDPGYVLVRACYDENIPVKLASGPSAFLHALLISGLPTDKFLFLGFPPKKPGKQKNFFEKYKNLDVTLLFYESPRRVLKTLENLKEAFCEWYVSVCRELSKEHEEVIRGKYEAVLKQLQGQEVLGEVVVALSKKI